MSSAFPLQDDRAEVQLSNGRLISPVAPSTAPVMDVQRRLPGGRYSVTAGENETFCAAVGATVERDGRAHPVFYYIATQAAMGLSVAELCALCDFDVEDGPMMAQSNVVFGADLIVDREYAVSGEIISLVRKASRKFGALDLLTYRLVMTDADGRAVAECTNQWVLPRRAQVGA